MNRRHVERPLIAALVGMVGLGVASLHAASAPLASHPEMATVRVVQTRDDGMLLELTAPLPILTVTRQDGRLVTSLSLPGTVFDAQPGAPPLPVIGALVAIPPGHTATLRVVEDVPANVALPAPLLVNAAHTSIATTAAALDTGAAPLMPDISALAAIGGPSPDSFMLPPAAIVTIAAWRSQTVAQVTFHPVQRAADGAQLIVHRRLLVALDFDGQDATTSVAHTAVIDEGAFEPLLQAALLNYAQGRAWRQRPAPVAHFSAQDERQWRVNVAASGLVRIDCTQLVAADAPVDTTPPAHWHVRRNGKAGPALATSVLDDNGDTRCDAGESLIFYADVQPTRYAADAVFWLSATAAPGAAILDTSPLPAVVSEEGYLHRDHYETNRLYYSYIPLAEDAEHWYWDILTPAISITRSYPFTVSEIANVGVAQVVLALAGYDGAHVTQVAVNGQVAAQDVWSGRRAYTVTASVPITWLHAGVNTLRISAVGAAPDLQYVDAFTVAYPRRLAAEHDRLTFSASPGSRLTLEGFSTPDVTIYSLADPDRPQRIAATVATPCPCQVAFDTPVGGDAAYLALTAAAYLTPTAITLAATTDLLHPTDGADYLVIMPAGLVSALDPLVAQRRAAGLRVREVDLQAIYDDFGDGRPDPAAIQRFLNHTLTAWPAPAPAYVLLVGDGSYDPRGYQAPLLAAALPAYLHLVDPVIGETASDNRFVTATPDSQLPQAMIGRLPVRTLGEATAVIAKILTFEAAGDDAVWRNQSVIVADNAYQSDGRADPAGNFWALADRAAAVLDRAGQTAAHLYYNPCAATTAAACDLPDPPYTRFGDAAALTTAFQSTVRAGRGLVVYTGHASPLSWAGAPYLLRTSDVATLSNRQTPFLALEMSCYTGFFHGPYDTLAETLVRAAEGGAVASWASSGQSPLRGQDVLLEQFLITWLADPAAGMTLGQAVLAAKLHLYGAGGGAYVSALDTFHLFGDPALVLRVAAPSPTPTILPTASPTLTGTETPTIVATVSFTATPTATAPFTSTTPAATSTPVIAASPTLAATPTPTPTPTGTPSPLTTPWQSATHTPAPSALHVFLPVVQRANQEAP
jgi:hypothetical protein